ncbi:MAG TPA_asm: hypothetical protein [Carjivirus communis]|uniref:Uncharacterized protein n=2 Tax=root TaxID=1 RepID=A0A348JCS0_9CAUD|nr:MAG: hypothetical protein OIE19_gp47 [Carjivirus communis]DAB41565.1 MAG TPA_asm: hypothetical protein [Carjivirus communis]
MPRKDKVIHISNLPSTFRGNVTRNGRFIQNGIPPLGGAYDKVAKSTGLIRLGNEFLYNGVNNLVSKDNREKLMNNTAGRLINYVKDFNKESFPSDDELGPTFPFNIIQTPRSNGKKLPQKQYAVGGKIPNVVAGGIAQPIGNNFFYMNGRKHSQGGIDIGPNDKTGIEVEDGEVVETNGNELKVYSAQPIINGVSPAKLVMGGANPNKVFKAQEDFKDRNRINDDGTKYKEGGKIYQAPDEYKRQIAESGSIIIGGYPTIAGNRNYKFIKGLTKASRIGRIATNFINLGRQKIYDLANKIDNTWINQGIKEVYRTTIGKHGSNLPRTIDYINKNNINENKKAMGGLNRNKDYGSKKKPYPSVAKKDFAGGHRSYPIPTKADAVDALRLAGLHGRSDVKAKVYNKYPELRKKGNTGLIVSISGNVKNGLIHSPSSTGGLRDKFAVGGTRINRHGRTWEYDEQIGAYVPITNRTINRTSTYPINKSARGETIVGSDYTFRNGRWSKNNNVNTNTNKPNIDNGNRRPQYYAERRLPLFEDGAGITSGLVRAGWSHGNNKGVSMNNINIPSLSATKSSGKTPRRGRSKSSQSTQSVPTKTPPTAVYNRNLPKVEASIPTTLPVSTNIPAKGTTSFDGKGQGKFKNLTTADWIGLGSNVAGSLASYFASRRAINKMRGPGQPTLISANKLKTKYNINPQLDRIREDKFEAYRDIDSNTASSRVSLARKQRVRNAAGQAANELYGNKENIETNLINQDRRNQQSVRQFNAQQYNQYIDRKAAFDNGIREAKVTNINNLFSGINAGIQDMISRYENRKALNNTIGAMRASAPNVDDRIMRDAGVDYDEFIIRKRRKLGGKQSCR